MSRLEGLGSTEAVRCLLAASATGTSDLGTLSEKS